MSQPTTTTTSTGTGTSNTIQNQAGSSTTVRDPYAPLIPYLNANLEQAGGLYSLSNPAATTQDPSAWYAVTGSNNSPVSPAGSPFTMVPNTYVNQGLALNTSLAQGLGQTGATRDPYYLGVDRFKNPIDAATQGLLGQFQDVYGGAQNYNTPINNLQGLAANTSGALTPVQQAILDQNAERISNRQASLYSGAGRYGSFGAGIGTARGIAETNNPLIAGFNQSNIQNALSANQLYGGLLGQQGGQQLGALGAGAGLYNTAQARAQQYGQMLPGLQQNMYMPGQVLQDAGNYLLNYPWQQLSNATRAVAGLGPLYGNAGSQSTAFNQNTNTFGNTTSQSQSEQSKSTPWTTYAGLGIAGLGLL